MIDERLFVGHRRLSILDLSEAANQPFRAAGSQALLSFNGEIYNFLELRPELAKRGVRFSTHSDTEVLYWALRLWGEDALIRFDGMFAGVWHDRDRDKHILFRDALGQKPLYYYCYDDGLIYASELRALLAIDGFRWRIDRDHFRRFLANGYYAWTTTPITGVRKLLPGSLLRVRGAQVEEKRWWHSAPGIDTLDIGPEEVVTETLRLLERSCRMTLRSDVPLGVFLSGGIDSSLIYRLCVAMDISPRSFTVTMSERDYDEGGKARDAVATSDAGGSNRHHEFHFDPPALQEAMSKVFAVIDEPHGDPGFINAYAISRAARSDITVALSGDGADELFCGYLPFKAVVAARALSGLSKPFIEGMRALARALPGSDRYLGLQFKALSFLNGLGAPPMERFNLWLSTLEHEEFLALTGAAGQRGFAPEDADGFFAFPKEVADFLRMLSSARPDELLLPTYLPTRIRLPSYRPCLDVEQPRSTRTVPFYRTHPFRKPCSRLHPHAPWGVEMAAPGRA